MTPEASAPIYQTLNATPLTLEEALCDKAKREIERFGVENALTRWRVICDYMHTEDWWPPVARKVEEVFDEAFKERNKQLQKERERQQSQVSITVSQQQTHEEQKTDNTFASGSNSQVFNGAVSGDFKKTS